jgi:hypothetical protein
MPFDQLTVDKMIVADDDSYTTARDWTPGLRHLSSMAPSSGATC